MKIRYKHQGFQAEAARNVVRAFGGQPFCNPQAKGGVNIICNLLILHN